MNAISLRNMNSSAIYLVTCRLALIAAVLVLAVFLRAQQHEYCIGVAVLHGLAVPELQLLEGAQTRDVVDQEYCRYVAVEGLDDRPEGLLTGSVPNLQLHLGIVVDLSGSRGELHAYFAHTAIPSVVL